VRVTVIYKLFEPKHVMKCHTLTHLTLLYIARQLRSAPTGPLSLYTVRAEPRRRTAHSLRRTHAQTATNWDGTPHQNEHAAKLQHHTAKETTRPSPPLRLLL